MATLPRTPRPAPGTTPRATRSREDRLLGGVASGLAAHLGWSVRTVRIAFVVGIALQGLGAVLYAAFWLVLPTEPPAPEAPGLEAATRQGRRESRRTALRDVGPLLALGAVAVGVALLLSQWLGLGWLAWPVVLAGGGLVLLWKQADDAQLQRVDHDGGRAPALDTLGVVLGRGGWAAAGRLALGVSLMLTSFVGLAVASGGISLALPALVLGLLALLGAGLMAGPWVTRLVRDLVEERGARVRSEERADVAAHLHDSVLQTLALIQRQSGDPAAVARLARQQERELRAWLFEAPTDAGQTLGRALRAIAARVEADHDVAVDVVVVGDVPAAGLDPLLGAAGEAVANAARHSGADRVDVYAEVAGGAVEVFVRDRGRGFDPDHVPDDRRGLRASIVERLHRHGGEARVRSAPGDGAELRLRLPLPTTPGGPS